MIEFDEVDAGSGSGGKLVKKSSKSQKSVKKSKKSQRPKNLQRSLAQRTVYQSTDLLSTGYKKFKLP